MDIWAYLDVLVEVLGAGSFLGDEILTRFIELGASEAFVPGQLVRVAGFETAGCTCHDGLLVAAVVDLAGVAGRVETVGEIWHCCEHGEDGLAIIPNEGFWRCDLLDELESHERRTFWAMNAVPRETFNLRIDSLSEATVAKGHLVRAARCATKIPELIVVDVLCANGALLRIWRLFVDFHHIICESIFSFALIVFLNFLLIFSTMSQLVGHGEDFEIWLSISRFEKCLDDS